MRILILGATGRTGRHLLSQALSRGHEVRVVVRDRHKIRITDPGLFVLQGHPGDRACLARVIEGCDAVISTLNISRYNDFPWAPLRAPKNLLSDVMLQIISLTTEHNISRVIFTSAWGVGETEAELPGWFRWLIRKSNLRYPYRDLLKTEELVRQSPLEWTAVRPTILTNSKKIVPVKLSYPGNKPSSLFISRASVASFMLDALEERLCVRETPTITG